MKPIESLWQETKQKFDKLEKAFVDGYIAFLREVARIYIEQSRRVFFQGNQFVHWGEWNFGSLWYAFPRWSMGTRTRFRVHGFMF